MLVAVRVCSTLPEAEVLVSLLNAHDVPAVVFDRNILSSFPDAYYAMGGFRVMAPEEDLPRARALMSVEVPPAEPGEEQDGEDDGPPSLGRGLSQLGGVLLGLFSGVPFAPKGRRRG